MEIQTMTQYTTPSVISVTRKPVGTKGKIAMTVVTSAGTFTRTTARPYTAIVLYSAQGPTDLARTIKYHVGSVETNRAYYEEHAGQIDKYTGETYDSQRAKDEAYAREVQTPEFAAAFLADYNAGKWTGGVTWHHSMALAQKAAAAYASKYALNRFMAVLSLDAKDLAALDQSDPS